MVVELEADAAQIGLERLRPALLEVGECPSQCSERFNLGLSLEGFNLNRATRLDDLLIGRGLRQADIRRDLVMCSVDRRQCGLNILWGINTRDQRRIENDPIA